MVKAARSSPSCGTSAPSASPARRRSPTPRSSVPRAWTRPARRWESQRARRRWPISPRPSPGPPPTPGKPASTASSCTALTAICSTSSTGRSPTAEPTATAATSPGGSGSAPKSPPPSGPPSARTSRSRSASRSGRSGTTTPGSRETPDELAAFLAPLADAGVSMFHVSTRRYWLPAFEGSDRTLAGWTRHLTGLPVIAIGSVGVATQFQASADEEAQPTLTLAPLVDLFRRGEFDLRGPGPRGPGRPRVGQQADRRPPGRDPPLRQVGQLGPVLTPRDRFAVCGSRSGLTTRTSARGR